MSYHDGYVSLSKHKYKPVSFSRFKRNGQWQYTAKEYRDMWAEGYESARQYEESGLVRLSNSLTGRKKRR